MGCDVRVYWQKRHRGAGRSGKLLVATPPWGWPGHSQADISGPVPDGYFPKLMLRQFSAGWQSSKLSKQAERGLRSRTGPGGHERPYAVRAQASCLWLNALNVNREVLRVAATGPAFGSLGLRQRINCFPRLNRPWWRKQKFSRPDAAFEGACSRHRFIVLTMAGLNQVIGTASIDKQNL